MGCDWTRAVFNLEYDHVSVGSSDGSVFIWSVSNPEKPEVVLRNEHGYGILVYILYSHNLNVFSPPRYVKNLQTRDTLI